MNMFTRREFTNKIFTYSAMSAGLSPLMAVSAWAEKHEDKRLLQEGIKRQRQFERALQKHPWLIGLQSPADEPLYQSDLEVTGTIPLHLTGDFFRNGPARHEMSGFRYAHLFDGDGMIQRFRFANGKVSHVGRYIETEKYREEKTYQYRRKNTFATQAPFPSASQLPKNINPANISVCYHNQQLLAFWEQDAPYIIDPETLDTQGKLIADKKMPFLPFSAHPKVTPQGNFYSFGYNLMPREMLLLYEKDSKGKMLNRKAVNIDKMAPVHDFAISKNHIVVVIPPVYMNDKQTNHKSFAQRLYFDTNYHTRVLVIDRQNFLVKRWYDLPAQWVFHHACCHEDKDGVLHLYSCRYANADIILKDFYDIMTGDTSISPSRLYKTSLYPNGKIVDTQLYAERPMSVEFPRMYEYSDTAHIILMLARDDTHADNIKHPFLNRIMLWDTQSEKLLAEYSYENDELAEEHCFIANPDYPEDERRAYIVGTCLDIKSQSTVLNIFRVDSLSSGPIARARLRYPLPLGFHGTYVART